MQCDLSPGLKQTAKQSDHSEAESTGEFKVLKLQQLVIPVRHATFANATLGAQDLLSKALQAFKGA